MNFTGFPPSDKSFGGVQEDTLERISRLERRRSNQMWLAGKTTTGILEATYIGPGPARVKLDGETTLSGPYSWVGNWQINGNRVVSLTWTGIEWVIVGHAGIEGMGAQVDLTPLLVNGWSTYNIANGFPDSRYTRPRVQRLPSGIVVLSGLIGFGTSSAGTVLLTLPAMYRPDVPMIFPIVNGATAKTIIVHSDGRVMVEGGNWLASDYVSLDGIAFPAAGVAGWTNVGAGGSAFQNGWSGFNTATWGPPRFWRDPYGIVWFSGLVGGGSTTVDNSVIFTLPATYQTHKQAHVKASSASTFGFVGAMSGAGQGISWKVGTTSVVWVSLGGVTLVTDSGLTNNNWRQINLVAPWINYDAATFPAAAVLRREDGLVMTKGLLRNGTIPSKIGVPRDENHPNSTLLLYGVSGQAYSRFDVYSHYWGADDDRGHLRVVTGTNAWTSLDGQMWMPGD